MESGGRGMGGRNEKKKNVLKEVGKVSAEGFLFFGGFFWHHVGFHPASPDWNGWECVNKARMFGQDLPPVFPVSCYRLLVCFISLKDENISLAAPPPPPPPSLCHPPPNQTFCGFVVLWFFFCWLLLKAKNAKMLRY